MRPIVYYTSNDEEKIMEVCPVTSGCWKCPLDSFDCYTITDGSLKEILLTGLRSLLSEEFLANW